METYRGEKIFGGIAIGKVLFYEKEQNKVVRKKIENVKLEIARYENAKIKAIEQLKILYDKALTEVGEVNAQIFDVHISIMEDDDYNNSVFNFIETQEVNAEYAVASTGDNFVSIFSNMEDEYFRAKAIDIIDITERIINVLSDHSNAGELEEPVILIANELAPSETVQFDKSKLLAFVTKHGSTNSHTAILARTMGIPAILGVDIQRSWNGKIAIVDGFNGKIIIEPEDAELQKYNDKKEKVREQESLLMEMKGKDTITKSGKKINLYANIGSVADLGAVIQNDAEGIGLFRSEFLYLEKTDFPTEEEQFMKYKQAAETLAGKKVIIRTMDIGADKQVEYFNLEKEQNPALGYRAIRICLLQQDIFKTQLRALFRASAFGNISIMYPMITSVEEVTIIKQIVAEVKVELDQQKILYGDVEEGIMIETPAAAIISDRLAEEVDFFSIGTNDLTQYTLAIDRQNVKLDSFYNAHHEAILRLIQMVVENAHKEGIWVGICGELGADMELTETFIKMGVDELSVPPGYILPIRKIIRESEV